MRGGGEISHDPLMLLIGFRIVIFLYITVILIGFRTVISESSSVYKAIS